MKGKIYSIMKRARILHLHSTFDMGGKEARSVQLMNHFGDEAEHVVLVGMTEALGARVSIRPGVRVDFPGTNAPSLMGLPGPKRYLELARFMQNFDLVLSYNWGAMDGVMARSMFAPFMKLPPVVHHEDGFNEDEAERLMPKRNWFRVAALLGAYGLVVPSLVLKDIAKAVWKQPVRKTHRIANGIATAPYALPPQKEAFPGFAKRDNEIVVGTVAGLRTVKNLPRLVRAVAAAGPNIRLAIAGSGPEKDAIEAEAKRLGISDRLMLGGFLQEPARFIGLFDIFALTSDSEQYPISLVEAMAAGLPAVATDVGDIVNMVSPENRDFIMPKSDETGLAGAIRSLANDEKLRKTIGAANARLARSEYDEQQMFNRYRKLYGSAMKNTDFARQI